MEVEIVLIETGENSILDEQQQYVNNQIAEEKQQFLTVKYNKGKRNLRYESDEESSRIQENRNEGNMDEDNGEDDTQSIHLSYSNISEHPIWRQNLGLKRYKARALVKDFLGKKYRKKTKGSYIAIYFNKKEELKKALDLEFINGDKEKFKLEEKSLNMCATNANNMQRHAIIWNLSVSIKKNELKTELEHRYGKVESISTVLGEMWQKAYVTFVDPEDARNFIKSWSQIIGEDIVRVTLPGVTTLQLKEREEHAVRTLGIPPGMTLAELYNEFKKIGAMTCYVPRNTFYARKRMAILSFESNEIKTGAIGYKWETEDFTVELIDMNVKACHRCYDITHLAKDLWKRHNPSAYNRIQKRLDPSYAGVLKTNNNTSHQQARHINKETNIQQIDLFTTQLTRSSNNDNTRQPKNWTQIISTQLSTITQQIQSISTRQDNIDKKMGSVPKLRRSPINKTKTTKETEKFIFFEQNQISNSQDPLYNIWWSSTTEAYNNNIGSGVSLMIKSNIAKHTYKIDKFEGHGICIFLSFKGRVVFQIIRIYTPNKYSSNNIILRKLKPWLYNHISQALSNNWISIIMGDWNATPNPSKDRFPVKIKTSPENANIDYTTLIANNDHYCAHVTLDVSKYCDGTSYKKYKRETEDTWEKQLQSGTNLELQKHSKYSILNILNKLYRLGSKIESTNNMNVQKLETIETMKNKLTNKYELNIQSFPSAGLPKEKLEW
ncbi:16295_t:CDS:2, partial [Dentiscutata erythropus]